MVDQKMAGYYLVHEFMLISTVTPICNQMALVSSTYSPVLEKFSFQFSINSCTCSYNGFSSNNGSVNCKRAHPPIPASRAFVGYCHLVRPGGGEFFSKPLPWGGAFVKQTTSFLFQ